jgi:hypothetical protein
VDEDRQSVDGGAGDALKRPPDGVDSARDEGLPPHLRRRLEATAAAWNRGEICTDSSGLTAPPASSWRLRAGWYVAVACGVLAIVGWWPRLDSQLHQPGMWWGAHQATPADRWNWQHAAGAADAVQGEVVWDNARQEGYVTLAGLAPTGTRRKQYQLWIYDAARDERYPVAAGTFDVPAGATHLTVPIKPALRIARPLAFAVTLEAAGGVVVPDHGHLVALARAGTH